MDLKQIEKLMMAMRRYGTKRLSFKSEGYEIELEREGEAVSPVALSPDFFEVAALKAAKDQRVHHLPRSETPPIERGEPAAAAVEALHVVSPMVGTFYRSPSPSDPQFVKVGDRIEAGTVVCIIEAMKVMNEIKAGVSGVVKEILVEDGHPVEFGTKLIRVV